MHTRARSLRALCSQPKDSTKLIPGSYGPLHTVGLLHARLSSLTCACPHLALIEALCALHFEFPQQLRCHVRRKRHQGQQTHATGPESGVATRVVPGTLHLDSTSAFLQPSQDRVSMPKTILALMYLAIRRRHDQSYQPVRPRILAR